eukprot:SAG31_NODE_13288_length_879_cov_1.820513_1_plen_158_part_00
MSRRTHDAHTFNVIVPSTDEHLEELLELYAETCAFHVNLDAAYYRPFPPQKEECRHAFAAAMSRTSGSSLGSDRLDDGQMRIAAAADGLNGQLIGFVTFQVQQEDGHTDTHYQRCGEVLEVYVRRQCEDFICTSSYALKVANCRTTGEAGMPEKKLK